MSNTGTLKKSRPLPEFLKAIQRPLKLSVLEWKNEFGDVYPILQTLELLKPSVPTRRVLCPNCDGHYTDVIFQDGNHYAACHQEAGIGRMLVDASQLSQEKFDFEGFLMWLVKGCGLEVDIAEVEDGLVWRLGTLGNLDKPATFYCVRSADWNEVSAVNSRLTEKKAVLFWLGEKPNIGHYPDNIISFVELISISNGTLAVKKGLLKPFKAEEFFAKSGDIELDKHICLHQEGKKCYLLLNKKNNRFEKKVLIAPQTYRIIKAVYDMRRKNPPGLKLAEFCHPRKIAANTRTISTRIKRLDALCKEHGINQILTKFPHDRWGLNPNLGCCKV